jgi:class 3 adenylate cyclase
METLTASLSSPSHRAATIRRAEAERVRQPAAARPEQAAIPALPPGSQDPVSLQFLDRALEARYQRVAGAQSRNGLRVITGASAFLWLLSALLVPLGTHIAPSVAVPAALGMAAASTVAFIGARWADNLDRQHLIAALLTSLNGLVILSLASIGSVLPGYGVSAASLLFAYGFVSQTRFVFAALRSAMVGCGFVMAALTYRGPGSLLMDGFIFAAAVVGTMLALYRLERSRRYVFYQEMVIDAQSQALAKEKDKTDRLLSNILPASIATRLRDGEVAIADEYPAVSILFADIVAFTPLAARLPPTEVVDLLSSLFTTFDELVAERGLEKIKTMGDSYMAAGGLPAPLDDHAVRTVDLGMAIIRATALESAKRDRPAISIRVGVHSGPVVGGVIGRRKFAFDVWGDTVNVASRLQSHGVVNRVHVSRDTWLLVSGHFVSESSGRVELRGHGAMKTYSIAG